MGTQPPRRRKQSFASTSDPSQHHSGMDHSYNPKPCLYTTISCEVLAYQPPVERPTLSLLILPCFSFKLLLMISINMLIVVCPCFSFNLRKSPKILYFNCCSILVTNQGKVF